MRSSPSPRQVERRATWPAASSSALTGCKHGGAGGRRRGRVRIASADQWSSSSALSRRAGPASLSITERRLGWCSVQHPRRLHDAAEEAADLGDLDAGAQRAAAVRADVDQARLPAREVGGLGEEREHLVDRAGDLRAVLEGGHRGRSFATTRPGIVTVRAVAPVDVMLLGPPRVVRDGTAVAFDTRKALALLAVLALADRPRPRDVLAELLWPEHDAEHARGALRRTLSTLRSGVGACRGRRHPRPGEPRARPGALASTSTASARWPPTATWRARRRCSAASSSRASGCATRRRSRTGSAPRPTRCGASSPAVLARLVGGDRRPRRRAALARARPAARARPPRADPALRRARRPRRRARAVPRVRAHALARAGRAAAGGDDAALRGDQRGHARGARPRGAAPPPARRRRARAPLVGREAEWRGAAGAPTTGSPTTVGSVLLEGEAGIGKTRLAEELSRPTRASAAPRCWAGAPTRRRRRSPTARSSRRCGGACARTTRGSATVAGARAVPRRRGCCPTSAPPLPRRSTGRPRRRASSTACGRRSRPRRPGRRRGGRRSTTCSGPTRPRSGCSTYGLRRLAGRRLLVLLTSRAPLRRVPAELGASALDAARQAERARSASSCARRVPGAVARARAAPATRRPRGCRSCSSSTSTRWAPTRTGRCRRAPASCCWPGSTRSARPRRQVLAAAAVIGRSFDVDTVRAAVRPRRRGDRRRARGARPARARSARGASTTTSRTSSCARLVAEETSLARRRLLHGRAADALAAGLPPAAVEPPRSPATSASPAATPRRPRPTAAPPSTRARCSPTPRRSSTCAPRSRSATREPGSLHAAIGDLQTLQGDYAAALASYETAAAHAAGAELLAAHRAPDRPGPPPPRRVGARHRPLRGRARRHARGRPRRPRPHLRRPLPERPRRRRPGARRRARRAGPRAGRGGRRPARARPGPQPARRARHQRRRRGRRARAPRPQSSQLAEATGDPGARVAALNNLALAHRARGELDPRSSSPARRSSCARPRATATARRRSTTTSPTSSTPPAAPRTRWTSSSARWRSSRRSAREGEPQPEVWKLARW